MFRANPVRLGYPRPALKREDDPQFWDQFHAKRDEGAAKLAAERPENWPQSRKLAILMIQRKDLALDCMKRLAAAGVRHSQGDFVYLRTEGYAVKDKDGKFHRLTASGWRVKR